MSIRYIAIPPALRPDLGQRSLWRVEGRAIALFNVDGTLYAIDDGCPHSGASLVGGILEGRSVRCRAHGLRFDLSNGCMPGAKGLRVRTYPIEMRGDEACLGLEEPQMPARVGEARSAEPTC
jgi:nitrite reductase/ring-hydroxylating ferredoxin subunit